MSAVVTARSTGTSTSDDQGLSVVRVGLLGFGVVGQAVARTATQASDRLAEAGVLIKCVAALVRDPHKPRVAPDLLTVSDPNDFPFHQCDVIVEALGGLEPARTLVCRALEAGIPVVTANKTLVAHHGAELARCAEAHGTTMLFEAAVLAGVPCVNTLARRPLASGAGRLSGILNGTSHFVLTRMANGETFERALCEARERGYAEPSSDADTSGLDAAEKLTILLHLAGHGDVTVATLPRRGLDSLEPWHLDYAGRLSGVIKPVALAQTSGPTAGAWVGPTFVPSSDPLAALSGVTNSLTVGAGASAVTFTGPGAGPEVTAATILDDVLETAARATTRQARCPQAPSVADVLANIPAGAWFIALDGVRSSSGDLAEILAARHLPAVFLVGDAGRYAAITAPASSVTLREVVDALTTSGVRVTWLPVLACAGEVSCG